MKMTLIGLCTLSVLCFSKDFGTRAHTFPTAEDNLSEHLQKNMQADMPRAEAAAEKAKNPETLKEISACQQTRTFTIKPEYISFEDIEGPEGNIIAKKGEKYNPLKLGSPNTQLLFLDGTNPKHIEWAIKQPKTSKWLLINGKPIDLEIKWQRPVYYDQYGSYAKSFNIQHVPAKVCAQDEKILVCEIFLKGAF